MSKLLAACDGESGIEAAKAFRPGIVLWWLRLGTTVERIRTFSPQQNGRHERVHLTLKEDAARPSGMKANPALRPTNDLQKNPGAADNHNYAFRPSSNRHGPSGYFP